MQLIYLRPPKQAVLMPAEGEAGLMVDGDTEQQYGLSELLSKFLKIVEYYVVINVKANFLKGGCSGEYIVEDYRAY